MYYNSLYFFPVLLLYYKFNPVGIASHSVLCQWKTRTKVTYPETSGHFLYGVAEISDKSGLQAFFLHLQIHLRFQRGAADEEG